jgi:SAM-dependent methyltransferase
VANRTAPVDVARYYDALVDRYGHDPRACDYGSAESQRVKFEVLSEVFKRWPANPSVLDVGCGFADYADFLSARVPGLRYTGVDLSARMVEAARRLHPALPIHHADILTDPPAEQYDVVNANGIFYLLGPGSEATMRKLVAGMFRLARKAVAFNSLSRWATGQEPAEFYADPAETLAMCRTITPWVALRHDYLAHDFTVYLYREPPLA